MQSNLKFQLQDVLADQGAHTFCHRTCAMPVCCKFGRPTSGYFYILSRQSLQISCSELCLVCVKPNNPLRCWVSTFEERGIQTQNVCQCLPMIFCGANFAVFPLPHRPHRNPCFCGHFRLRKVGFDTFQKQMVTQRFRIDGDELSGAKSASRMLVNDMDCPLCNSQQRALKL
jgi:hypothetical protein